MFLKRILKNHLFYTALITLIFLLTFYTIHLNKNINIILFAIICGILNSYIIKIILFIKNNELQKKEKKQRETYISTLNHDLKIPTLAQIQALQLLSNEKIGKINKRQKEIVNLTLESCTYMYEMLSTILSTYKYENQDFSLCFEKIYLLKVIDECFNQSISSLQNKNLRVKINSKEKFFTIIADKKQIKKALENIINHCISSADENTEIICEIKHNNNNIFLSLGFESSYISADTTQNLLKKYTTSAEKFDKVGSSLGLYLAKQIISAHNGSINVESRQADYNIYNIELPCINECKLSSIPCHKYSNF